MVESESSPCPQERGPSRSRQWAVFSCSGDWRWIDRTDDGGRSGGSNIFAGLRPNCFRQPAVLKSPAEENGNKMSQRGSSVIICIFVVFRCGILRATSAPKKKRSVTVLQSPLTLLAGQSPRNRWQNRKEAPEEAQQEEQPEKEGRWKEEAQEEGEEGRPPSGCG